MRRKLAIDPRQIEHRCNRTHLVIVRHHLFKAERIKQLLLIPLQPTHHGPFPPLTASTSGNHCSRKPSNRLLQQNRHKTDMPRQPDDVYAPIVSADSLSGAAGGSRDLVTFDYHDRAALCTGANLILVLQACCPRIAGDRRTGEIEMQYVCDAPDGKTWFRIETEGEAAHESRLMSHAVEKYFRRDREKAVQSWRPERPNAIERDIGLEAHVQREMPLFLTLRDGEGNALSTAMLPPGGKD